MNKALLEPILESGIRSTFFFNGRMLSGEDLAREQTANTEARRRLGQAIGDGVAYGLEVAEAPGSSSIASPVVTITAGAAISRKGDVLVLPNDTDISLLSAITDQPAPPSDFKECEPPTPGGYVVGEGAYALVIAPAQGREGRAPVSGLGNATASCNSKYTVDGVRFRLVPVAVTLAELIDPNRLRNRLAHRCFGTADTSRFPLDVFAPSPDRYGAIDALRDAGRLTDCDVPIAVVLWTAAGGIRFVDPWMVRRRVTQRPVTSDWSLLVGDRRASDAEAMFLQFQDHLVDLVVTESDPRTIVATDRFAFLPPAGAVPIATFGQPRGFDGLRFFGEDAWSHAVVTDGNLLRSLFHDALYHEPIELTASTPLQVYTIYDNVKALERGDTARLTAVFASSSLAYRGVARFQYGSWDLSRFVPPVI